MIEAGIRQMLLAAAVVQRMDAVVLPDRATYPATTYQRISTTTSADMDAALSLTTMRLQIDCWAQKYEDAKAQADAIVEALEGFSGALPSGDAIADVSVDTMTDYYDEPSSLYRSTTDFLISFYR